MQRFWDQATFVAQDGGWGVLLDGKPMRLPGGTTLTVETAALAAAIALEWQQAGGGKGGTMGPHHVPLTGLAGTAQNHVAKDPAVTIAGLAAYGETDLLCYRATGPEALVRRQAAEWQKWLDWAALELDAPLRVTNGIVHVAQPPDALASLRRAVARLDVARLAALGVIVPSLGSLVLGLAVAAGALEVAEAHRIATVDERFQAEFWGEDGEAAERRARIAADLAAAAMFMRLSRRDDGKEAI
jgi:chaperone required for assembly of F1-ATPase